MTDEFHARRFVDLYSARLRYCLARGGWLAYDGMRWRKDDQLTPERLAREAVQSLREYLPRIRDKGERREFEAAIRKAETLRAIRAMIGLARSDARIVVSPEVFDRDHFLFNCRNGTIDLRTGQLHSHNPNNYLTKLAPVNYRPDATCPIWDAALSQCMNGDEEMIGFLRRSAGYALTGSVREHCLFLLYGTGRNGKTLLLEALLGVVGREYGMMAPNHLLTSSGRTQHLTAVADLDGMRMVVVSEPSGGHFDEAQMKMLTGGESIRANRMHQDHFQFEPTHKLFMASNHKPATTEFHGGLLESGQAHRIRCHVHARPAGQGLASEAACRGRGNPLLDGTRLP